MLVLIGAYLDSGVNDPPIRWLRERLHMRPAEVMTLIQRLERDRFIKVKRGAQKKHERNQYTLTLEDGRADD